MFVVYSVMVFVLWTRIAGLEYFLSKLLKDFSKTQSVCTVSSLDRVPVIFFRVKLTIVQRMI